MRKLLSTILSLSLVSTAAGAFAAAPLPLENGAVSEAVMQRFLPEDAAAHSETEMTRASFIQAIARFDDAPEQTGQLSFSDILPTADYFPALVWAFENGLIQGVSSSEFAPDSFITREQAAVILERYFTLQGWFLENASLPEFKDLSSVSGFAYNAVVSLSASGFFSAFSGNAFGPQLPLTYHQAADILLELSDYRQDTDTEFLSFTAFDGYSLEGKLNLPAGSSEISKLVVFVNGSGPNTYNNRRAVEEQEFNYFDVFAEQLNQENIAFFRSNTRGVSIGTEPPLFSQLDEKAYQTYLPQNVVRDNETMINALKQDPRLKNAKVYLLGWSEGTIIAPAIAAGGNAPVDGLLLAGYCNESLDTILKWQNTGGSSMIFYREYFDYDEDGTVTKSEFEEDRYQLKEYLGASFEEIDLNQNKQIDAQDFAIMMEPLFKSLLEAIENRDDEWLKNNYPVHLTSAWFLAHRQFPPNKTTLPTLDLPIHIFHGTYDANVSVQQAYDIEETFRQLGKTNLTTHIYPKADHDLNYMDYLETGQLPEGFVDIFRTCVELDSPSDK